MENFLFHWVPIVITGCSLAHTLLPPWEMLDEFPSARRYYRLFVYIVGYVALNLRSTAYAKQISMPAQVKKANGERQKLSEAPKKELRAKLPAKREKTPVKALHVKKSKKDKR